MMLFLLLYEAKFYSKVAVFRCGSWKKLTMLWSLSPEFYPEVESVKMSRALVEFLGLAKRFFFFFFFVAPCVDVFL